MFLLPGGSEKAIIDLINSQNDLPKDIAPGDLYFGKVSHHTPNNGTVDVPLVAVIGSDFEGYLKLNYKRLSLTNAYGLIKPTVQRVGYPSLHRLLPMINDALGLSLSPKDVLDVPITWLSNNEQVNIPIVAAPDSLGYEGKFSIRYIRVRPELADLAVKILTALKHPISPSLGMKSLAMRLWSEDFTDYQQSFRVGSGVWVDIAAVRAHMALYGFDQWPQAPEGQMKVQATKDVPTANKKYTSVIIQKGVTIGGHQGDAYFHFNR